MRPWAPAILLYALLLTLPAVAADSVGQQVTSEFQNFCRLWLHKKNDGPGMPVTCTGIPGSYVAQYCQPSKRFSCEVIPTGKSAAPYVGKLCYRAETYVCTAGTREGARQGPYHQAKGYPVTEIFLYQNGVWTY